jgi:hypothetical protein
VERALDAGAIVGAEGADTLDDVRQLRAPERLASERGAAADEARLGDAAEVEHDLEQLVGPPELREALPEPGREDREKLGEVVVGWRKSDRLCRLRRFHRFHGRGGVPGARRILSQRLRRPAPSLRIMRAMRRPAPLALACLLTLAVPAAAHGDERLRYRWSLRGFVGALASLFVPGGGDGQLSLVRGPNGVERGELLVTSTESRSGEYFRYGSEWEGESGRMLRAWSDLFWRGERKSKEESIRADGVIDVVFGIHTLRRDPPEVARRLEIWSDGRLYPVLVVPGERETRRLRGREVGVRRYSVRGLQVPGRRVWRGELELWIADDEEATPVEILVSRRGARVLLQLVEEPHSAEGGNSP